MYTLKLSWLILLSILITTPLNAIIIKHYLERDTKSLNNNNPTFCDPRRNELPHTTKQIRSVWVDFGTMKLNTQKKTISFKPTVTETYCTYYGQTMKNLLDKYKEHIIGKGLPRVLQVGLYIINQNYRRPLVLTKGKRNFSYYITRKLFLKPVKQIFKRVTFNADTILDNLREGDSILLAIDYNLTIPHLPKENLPSINKLENLPFKDAINKQLPRELVPLPITYDSLTYVHQAYLPNEEALKMAKKYLKLKTGHKISILNEVGPRFTFRIQKLENGYRIYDDHWYNRDIKLDPSIATGPGEVPNYSRKSDSARRKIENAEETL